METQVERENENPIPSIFHSNLLELLLGIVAGGLMAWSYRSALWSVQPLWFESAHMRWFTGYRDDLFLLLVWFYFLLGFLTAVSLIRSLRKQSHRVPRLGRISPRGYFSLLWPIPLLIPDLQFFFIFSLFISCPIVFAISFIICAHSNREYGHRGDLLPIFINSAASLPLIYNTIGVWTLIGD